MRRIKLTQGKYATVDDRFYGQLVAMGPWQFNNYGYAVSKKRSGRSPSLLMHRVVMELAGVEIPPGFEVDHRHGRRCDNRLNKLRVATHMQNRRNSGKRYDNTSGHKGVTWRKSREKWQAQIGVAGKTVWLGEFDSKYKALVARRLAEKRYFGEFARTAA
jgi:hypothetical protein